MKNYTTILSLVHSFLKKMPHYVCIPQLDTIIEGPILDKIIADMLFMIPVTELPIWSSLLGVNIPPFLRPPEGGCLLATKYLWKQSIGWLKGEK